MMMVRLLAAVAAILITLPAAHAQYSPQELVQVRMQTEVALSPDGRRVAFVSDISGTPELWTVPAKGGWPHQVTSLREKVHHIAYSPDGRWIYFTSDFGGDERGDLYRVPSAGGKLENLTRSKRAERNQTLSPDGKRLAFTADPGEPFLFQLFVLDLETRKEVQLTREPVNVHQPVWSRDGKLLAVTRSGDDQRGELLLVDPNLGRVVREVRPPYAGGILFAQAFSPDGRQVLATVENTNGFMQLALVPVAKGAIRFIGPGQWDVEAALWSQRGILFDRNVDGRTGLYHLAQPNARASVVIEPAGVIASFDADRVGDHLVYLQESSQRPADVWSLGLGRQDQPRQLTFSFVGGVKASALSPSRIIHYKSKDGLPISALYIAPRVHRLGTPPPVIAHIHGGPDYQAFDDFYPIRQALAEAGFAVFAPNYRGSAGYGRGFLDANNMDWGGADLQDIVSGIDYLAAKGQVDPKRAGITGGSYGGFMTLTALTKTPDRWRAGVEAYGMADLVLDYRLGGKQFFDWYHTEMGSPKSHPKLFRERSPIQFLDRIKAPLLIFQGANDTNVPLEQSRGIHRALKKRGLQTELVVYPNEGHGFYRRPNRLDWIKRTVEFFVEHVGARPTRTSWKDVERETLEHLRALVRMDTSNPPGNEIAVARYLKRALAAEGIPSRILTSKGTRASLVARLKGTGKKRPLLLMSHSDVVPVDRKQWTVDPFAAKVQDGYLYGRGTADVKCMVAAELMILILLKRNRVRLDRDVIFLAQADEESGGSDRHVDWLVKNHWDLLDAELAINEGGYTRWQDGKITAIDLQCAEKEYLDLTIVAEGRGGHSSVPVEEDAITVLLRGLARLSAWKPAFQRSPVSLGYLKSVAGTASPELRAAIKQLSGARWRQAAATIERLDPELGAILRDTVAITVLKAGHKSNVIPARAEATLNARLLPGRRVEDFVARLRQVMNEPRLKIRYRTDRLPPIPPMPLDTDLVKAVREVSAEYAPGAPVRPFMAAWSTDSQAFRAKGIKVYGFDPPLSTEDAERVHGQDERLSLAAFDLYMRMLYQVVVKVAEAR